MLVPVPSIQLEELIHELSSDNVRENLSAATFKRGVFGGNPYLKRTEVKNPEDDGLDAMSVQELR